ncbi:MAG: SusC/RagA family TonB-linked outer membrane protein [Prevotellaceae bacterium]|jgi:TonB-linked SusC/RagA family outer membrane protein|nr:SusC/RagA family TonB-linked outer membrane protein [Prevotellaceae bacterium]
MNKKIIKLLYTPRKALLTICVCVYSCVLFSQGGINVTGTVTDLAGEALQSASVTVKGTTVGVLSGADGKYSINVSDRNAVLVFSFVGFTAKEITVGSQTVINVSLKEGEALEEVVVTALGISREAKALGYAVTTISAKELTKVGTSNFATALYGKASGVRIQNTQGGVAGGVSINVRGLSSINGNTQPLVILNGVPVRNGNATNGSDAGSSSISARDFSSIGSGGRIRSNGLVDINPEDIETISILKGAAATALYGSEAANGAIIITSKRATGTGVTVDANVSFQANFVANVPPIQTKYGPGGTTESLNDEQIKNGGFNIDAVTGKRYPDYQRAAWGPAFDGKEVLYVDGKTRAYSPISTKPWNELFRTGISQIYNIALNQGSNNSNNRFSYTYVDETPNALSGDYGKHNFNLVGTVRFNDKLWLDYTGNYIVQRFVNRAQASLGVYGSYSDMFNSFLDIPMMKRMYKTSMGYINTEKGAVYTMDEYFKYNSDAFVNGVRGMLWNIYENNSDELEQRFIASVAPTWKIADFLTAKARLATDHTATAQEERNRSQYPAAAYPNDNEVTGAYTTLQKSYQILYGDVMLMFNKKLSEKVTLTANAGWQARTEKMNSLFAGTNGGLAMDNVFQLTNGRKGSMSVDPNTNRKMELLKTAWVGSLGVSYGDFVFLDLTGRQETSSTLPAGSRDYFYPSASASFLYSDAFALPAWYQYGKLRLSYGIVGNAPEAYAANMAYIAQSDPGGFLYNQIPANLGNNGLKPETTKEFEIGIENKFLENRFGFEISYYNRRISDMLVQIPLAPSSGSSDIWVNSGVMTNRGVEFSLYGTPVQTRNFSWYIRANAGFNTNNIESLAAGVSYIQHNMYEGGMGYNRSFVGRSMGDYFSHVYKVVESGPHAGRRVVNADGNYVMLPEQRVVANAMPKAVGGIGTSLSYRDWALDVMTDFRIGGYVFNRMYYNSMAMGVNVDTRNREGAGFLTYTNPDKGITKQNGIVLDGVVEQADGSYEENATVIPYDGYVASSFGVSGGGVPNQTMSNGLFRNNWWKLRELALSYSLPKGVIEKTNVLKNLTMSVFGRNLFYIYKAIPNYDPETSNGTDWKSQLEIGASASPVRSFGVSVRATF